MNKKQAIDWMKKLGSKVPAVQQRGGWVTCECPLGPWEHDNGKSNPEAFGIKIMSGDSFCNCFSCGFHGSQSDLILRMRYLNKKTHNKDYPFGELQNDLDLCVENAELEGIYSPDIEEMLFGEGKVKPHVFPDWWLESFPKWHEVGWAIEYLSRPDRDVPTKVADFLDIRVDPHQKRVCFPIRDFAGKLMGFHGRAIEDDVEPRYRMYLQANRNNPIIWMGEHWIDTEKPIVVVEGPFDLASVYRVYRNVCTPLFANPSEKKLKRMGGAAEWITFLDAGKGGDKGRQKIEAVMGKSAVVKHVVPPNGKKDPGVLTTGELVATLDQVVEIDPLIVD